DATGTRAAASASDGLVAGDRAIGYRRFRNEPGSTDMGFDPAARADAAGTTSAAGPTECLVIANRRGADDEGGRREVGRVDNAAPVPVAAAGAGATRPPCCPIMSERRGGARQVANVKDCGAVTGTARGTAPPGTADGHVARERTIADACAH